VVGYVTHKMGWCTEVEYAVEGAVVEDWFEGGAITAAAIVINVSIACHKFRFIVIISVISHVVVIIIIIIHCVTGGCIIILVNDLHLQGQSFLYQQASVILSELTLLAESQSPPLANLNTTDLVFLLPITDKARFTS
jgi:hypothetical protein